MVFAACVYRSRRRRRFYHFGSMKILHIVTGLMGGGAEFQLCRMCVLLQTAGFEQKVVSLLPDGTLSPRIRDAGIELTHLDLRRGGFDITGVMALRHIINQYRPDVLHSWMYHACVYSAVASAFIRQLPVLWSIHHSSLTFADNSVSTLGAASICGPLSYSRKVHIAYCAESARLTHEARGYCRHRSVFIPNGYDGVRFRRSTSAGEEIRSRFNISAGSPVFGLVARFDPIKDHATFLEAASVVRQSHPKVTFLLIGEGVDESNTALMDLVVRHGVDASVILAGRCEDMVAAYSAFNSLVLSSRGEAFPNVICEGMLCELPCIATDVGDCRAIVDDCGFIVPAGSASLLSEAMLRMLDLTDATRAAMGNRARERIVTNYSEETALTAHLNLYASLARGGTFAT
jgi:glycosyltransferase involved in cell wall biosynthesis